MSKEKLLEEFLKHYKEIPHPEHNPKKFRYLLDIFMFKKSREQQEKG